MSRDVSVAVVAACPFPFSRGTPIRIHRLSDSIARLGTKVHVVSYHLGQDDPDASYRLSRIADVPTYTRLDPGPSYQKLLLVDPLLMLSLRRLLKSERIDLIHAHHYEGLITALAARSGLPIIYDAHTLLSSELQYYRLGFCRSLKLRLGRYLDRALPRKADHIVAVTDRLKQQLVDDSMVAPDQIDVIHNGVNMEPFLNAERSTEVRDNTIVFAGNLAGYQGIDKLLRAFRIVLDTMPNARLLIVTSSDFDEHEDLAISLGIRDRIDLEQSEFAALPNHLARARVAVSPRTQCDGIPQKILNYMAAELPTVAFEGSAPTLTHGETGWLVEDEDISAFAHGICELLSNPERAQTIGSRAKELATRTYSWESSAEKTVSVYERVLRRLTNRR